MPKEKKKARIAPGPPNPFCTVAEQASVRILLRVLVPSAGQAPYLNPMALRFIKLWLLRARTLIPAAMFGERNRHLFQFLVECHIESFL